MRNHFIDTLFSSAKINPDLYLMIGDLGYGVVDEYASSLPRQFLNAGIAEQNMVGMAAGLSSTGKHVFVYSIANFPTFRALEQVRNDVSYHQRSVTVVSVGAGLGYGVLGYSHYAVEDIAIMSALPHMTIYSPIDSRDAARCLEEIIERKSPSYIRLGKGGEKDVFDQNSQIQIGENTLIPGKEKWVITTGSICSNVLEAVKIVSKFTGCPIGVIGINKIHPLELNELLGKDVSQIATIEEHILRGGLYTSVLEKLNNSRPNSIQVLGIGIENPTSKTIGSQEFMRNHHGLSVNKLVEKLMNFFI